MTTGSNRATLTHALLRVVVSLMMLAKAVPGVVHGPGALTVLMTVLGLLVLIGLGTRIAAALAALLMATIYALFHAPHGFSPVDNGGVPAILSAAIFLHLAVVGPGRWSVDGLRTKRRAE